MTTGGDTPIGPESPDARLDAVADGPGGELLEDGQEEVFAYSAVERGEVADPAALGPEDIARFEQARQGERPPGG